MNKFKYWTLVFLFSLEFFVLVTSLLFYIYFEPYVLLAAGKISLNSELSKILMAIPAGLAVWIFSESRQLVFDSDSATKILVAWDGYWKLKVHICVAVIYAVIFVVISFIPWINSQGISSAIGLISFVSSFVGQAIVSASVYFARFKIREILVNAPKLS